MTKGILVVISGFSGAGKGTVVKKLLEKSDDYCLSVSMTTRSPRPGEVDGKDYFFHYSAIVMDDFKTAEKGEEVEFETEESTRGPRACKVTKIA